MYNIDVTVLTTTRYPVCFENKPVKYINSLKAINVFQFMSLLAGKYIKNRFGHLYFDIMSMTTQANDFGQTGKEIKPR